jgi:hypothetical protein
MVSTVFSKKQFCFIRIFKSEDVLDYINDLTKNHNHMILYPVNSKKEVENVSDLIDEKMQKALISEIESEHPQTKNSGSLSVKNWNGLKAKGVSMIEHLRDDMFRIYTEHGTFISNSFELCLG